MFLVFLVFHTGCIIEADTPEPPCLYTMRASSSLPNIVMPLAVSRDVASNRLFEQERIIHDNEKRERMDREKRKREEKENKRKGAIDKGKKIMEKYEEEQRQRGILYEQKKQRLREQGKDDEVERMENKTKASDKHHADLSEKRDRAVAEMSERMARAEAERKANNEEEAREEGEYQGYHTYIDVQSNLGVFDIAIMMCLVCLVIIMQLLVYCVLPFCIAPPNTNYCRHWFPP